jgi:nucleotide-binding universal stress UspA family protein
VLHLLRDEDYEAAIEAERVLETLLPDGTRVGEPNPDDVARTVARADLQRILSREDEHDTRAEYLLRPAGIDGPSAAIADCAREMGVDLIVIGKHTIGRLEHLIAGSVTEKVLGQAPCPVMVVKHTGQERVPLEDLAESADA